MSILSTSSKLVRVGDSYSAGEGISIENNTISVTGDYGHAYYPGENISISDDNVISSKDWSSDIDTAAQNVSAETTAWVSEQGYITDASLSDYALITDVETTSGLLKMDIDAVSASITGKMDTTAFNDWQNGQYTNDIGGLSNDIDTVSGAVDAVSGAVSSLDIPTHQEIINASGYAYSQSTAWTDSQGYLTQHQDISNLATKDEVSAYTLTTTLEQVSGDIVGLIPDVSDFITNASAEVTYQPIGQYASASDITGFATKNELETTSGEIVNLIPSTAGLATEQLVQDTSATITGMIPSTAGLATETDLQIVSGGVDYVSGALTGYQVTGDYATTGDLAQVSGNITGMIPSTAGLMQESELEISDNKITGYNGTAFAGQGGGSIDTIPVAVISPLVTGFSGESAYLGIESTALNLSSYVPVSAIGVNSQGYVSGISGKNISAYYSRNSLTANYANTAERAYHDRNNNEITSYYQPKLTITGDAGTITSINGSAVGASIPAGWELVAGAGIEIVDDAENNQTTISVTAAGGNPEVESYVQSSSASIDDAVSTYQTNSANYLTAHQPISANEWNSNYDTVISNSASWGGTPLPMSAGDGIDIQIENDTLVISATGGAGNPEVESYVQTNSAQIDETVTTFQTNSSTYMVEPNLEYNAVNEISGYNGSAIAQYGAEKQWLQHDDTIVHVANSAQYALGVNLSAVAQLLGVDETVLFSGEASTTITLSESPLNFNKIRVYTRVGATVGGNQNFGCGSYSEFLPYSDFNCALITGMFAGTSGNEANIYNVATKWTGTSGKNWNRTFYGFRAYTATGGYSTAGNWISPYVIVGVGRKI